jgi:oxygen-independent coproporphyrinogen III oxidase
MDAIVTTDLEVDLDLIRRFDRLGPRYTSYPTADRFVEAFNAEAYESWVKRRNVGGITRPLSLYVHIPFCGTVCFYCACNKVVTRDKTKADVYLKYLAREIGMQARLVGSDNRVEQMHWGGGTPNFLSTDQMAELTTLLRRSFDFAPDGEYSIEIDPRSADVAQIARLAELGFNRMSVGVQDFDADVQKAVNRIQGEDETIAVIDAAREHGFESVNIDLMYGLPKQDLISFNRTLARILGTRPDRVAIYNYAHLPQLFKPQRRIKEDELPSPDTKLKLLALAIRRLTEAGYVYIGMDHFARYDDSLAVAQRQGRLHRNFQGYSTHAECDLIGLGVTSIGNVGPTYSQNYRTLEEYYDRLDRGILPVMRGLELSADDLLRRAVISALMCHFEASKESFEIAYLIDFDRYFATELAELAEFERLGLVQLDPRWITITPKRRLLVRNLAMVFDKYLRQDQERRRYSKVI